MTSAPATISIDVVKANSATTVAASPNPSVYGASITFTASVASVPSGSSVPGGSVTFMEGAASLGVADVVGGSASLATASLGAGTHALSWDRREGSGARAAAGVYFVRARAAHEIRSQRVVLLD